MEMFICAPSSSGNNAFIGQSVDSRGVHPDLDFTARPRVSNQRFSEFWARANGIDPRIGPNFAEELAARGRAATQQARQQALYGAASVPASRPSSAPAKKDPKDQRNYGGEHVGNQRAQTAAARRPHIMVGGAAEGEYAQFETNVSAPGHWPRPQKLDDVIRHKETASRAQQEGMAGAFLPTSSRFSYHSTPGGHRAYGIHTEGQRLGRSAKLYAKLGVDKVKLAIPSVIDTTPQAGHHTVGGSARILSAEETQRSLPKASMRGGSWPTTTNFYDYPHSQRGYSSRSSNSPSDRLK